MVSKLHNINMDEIKKAQRYHKTFEAMQELYKLMKKVALAVGIGYEDDDHTATLNLDIGGGTLSYDPYYQKLFYCLGDDEYELRGDELETVQELIAEIEKRFEAFKQQRGMDNAKGVFRKPLNGVFNKELEV